MFGARILRCSRGRAQASFKHQTQLRAGHTVRIILTEDLPNKGYKDEVVSVRAGFARNCLIPGKKALYATPANFERLGIVDPDSLTETAEERQARLLKEAEEESEDKRAADLLKRYLSNKTLKIYRNAEKGGRLNPGIVNAQNVRDKLSKQLKIDLDDHETVTLLPEPINFAEIDDLDQFLESRLLSLKSTNETGGDADVALKDVALKALGEYLAAIRLPGGFDIPLRVSVVKR